MRKFKIGDKVRYKKNPEIKSIVVEHPAAMWNGGPLKFTRIHYMTDCGGNGYGLAITTDLELDVGPPPVPALNPSLSGTAEERKAAPMFEGLLAYFPNALAAIAHVSKVGNDQHNPGQPMHWAFGKSTDEADCIIRHLAERGSFDKDGLRHSAKVAWRACALLERELLAAYPELKPGVNVKK